MNCITYRNLHATAGAYLDDVYISTTQPSGMTEDIDNDGQSDADEIDTYGNLSTGSAPTLFLFK